MAGLSGGVQAGAARENTAAEASSGILSDAASDRTPSANAPALSGAKPAEVPLMNFTLLNGETIYGAIARAECMPGEHPYTIMRRMLVGTTASTINFALPNCLEAICRNLPRNLGVTPDEIIDRHTLFPAVAPLLDEAETQELRRRMRICQRGTARLPVCKRRDFDKKEEYFRYCPVCAQAERSQGLMIASWRMPHQLYGVEACELHACRLIYTRLPIVTKEFCHDADTSIPLELPPPERARDIDVALARDVAVLFSADCPRPGRLRLAIALKNALESAGYAEGLARRTAVIRLFRDLRGQPGTGWSGERGSKLETQDVWARNWTHGRPNVVPAYNIAVVGRFLNRPLPQLLEDAQALPLPFTGRMRRSHPPVLQKEYSAEKVAKCREKLLAALAAHPSASRTRLQRLVCHDIRVLAAVDPDWLYAQLPAKKSLVRRPHRDWPIRDLALAAKVRQIAENIRAEVGRPRRITHCLLEAEGRRGETFACGYTEKLPRYNEAISACAEDNTTFAKRRCAWLAAEIQAGRETGLRSRTAFLRRAGLLGQAYVDRDVADAAKPVLDSLWPKTTVASQEATLIPFNPRHHSSTL